MSNTAVYLSVHHMAKEHVHALKGLVCCKRVAAASSPAATCKQVRRSRHRRDTLAAAPSLLAHASVTEVVKFCPMGPKLWYVRGRAARSVSTEAGLSDR